LLKVAGITTFVIMLIVGADVFMRYVFHRPFSWSYDLVGIYLLPLSFFMAVSAAFRRNHHIAVDILYLRFPEIWKRIARLFIALTVIPMVFWLVWLAAKDSEERLVAGDAISGTVLWPTWIPSAMVAAGFAVLFVRLLLDAIALIGALLNGGLSVLGESPERQSDIHHEDEAI
jgi:TRAP-type C4-dicarboxylate transport system permease small subunit